MSEIDQIIFQESPKTFMEILKVSNKEVPFANALAFFFRPNEKHGLGTLFIDSLLATQCYELSTADKDSKEDLFINKGCGCSASPLQPPFDKDSVQVLVEQKVGLDKRIDLLIVADKFVICIEFKINHDLDNPLGEYRKYVADNYGDKRQYFVVLTPYRKKATGAASKFIASNAEFKLVILSHFVRTVKDKMNAYSNTDSESRYYGYFRELVQTVENRKIRHIRGNTLIELSQRINESGIACNLHNKNGGFLEIKENGSAVKVRVKPSGWQFEKWLGKERVDVVTIEDKKIGYNGLVERVREYFEAALEKDTLKAHC